MWSHIVVDACVHGMCVGCAKFSCTSGGNSLDPPYKSVCAGIRAPQVLFWWYRQNNFDKADCDKKGPPPNRTVRDCTWGFEPGGQLKATSCKTPKKKPGSPEL